MAGNAVGERQAQSGGASSAENQDDWGDFDDLIRGGSAEAAGGRGVASGEDDDDELSDPNEGEDEEDDDGGEAGAEDSNEDDEAEGEDGEKPSAPGGDAAERLGAWADTVRSKPQRLSEVPPRHRAGVLQEALRREREAGKESLRASAVEAVRKARQQGRDEAAARHQSDAEFEEVRELFEGDREAFADLVEKEPAKVAAFAARLEAERNPGAHTAHEGLQQQAEALAGQLQGKAVGTAHLRKIYQEHGPERWPMTPEGIQQLTRDVAEALAEERVAARRAEEEPTRKAAQKREAAAGKRRELPRPGSEGPRGGGRPASGDDEDWVGNISAGFAEARKPRK